MMNRSLICFGLIAVLSACSSDETTSASVTDVVSDTAPSVDAVGATDVGVGPEDTTTEPEDVFVPPPECTSAADCDDDNPCTKDACGASGCVYTEETGGSCDDGDACTSADACVEGVCTGVAMDCDDDNICTVDWCAAGECKAAPEESEPCAMKVIIDEPQRASTLTGQGPFYVSGSVVSPASTPTLTINEQATALSFDGSFNVLFEPSIGVNIIDVEAMDAYGRSTDVALSFMYAPSLMKPGADYTVPTLQKDMMGVWLDQPAFDDDNLGDLDDLATVVWLLGETYDVNAAIPHPLITEDDGVGALWCDYTVDVTDIDYTVEDVEIDLVSGGMDVSLVMADFTGFVDAVSDGWDNIGCPNAGCDLKADQVYLDAQLNVAASPSGDIVVTLASVNVEIVLPPDNEGVNCTGGTAQFLNWLINWFEGTLADYLEDQLEVWAVDELVPLVNGVIDQFTDYQVSFEVPSFEDQFGSLPIHLRVAPGGADWMDGEAIANLQLGLGAAPSVPYTTPGSIHRHGCGQGLSEEVELPNVSVAEAWVHEDLLNHFLYITWRGGLAKLLLTDEIVGPYLGDLGVSNVDMSAELTLPPVITTCTENGELEVQFGDVYAEGSFDYAGGPVQLNGYASARCSVKFKIEDVPDGPNQLGIEMLDVLQMAVDIQEIEGMDEAAETLVANLLSDTMLDLIVNSYLSEVSQSYPLPVIDLDTWLSDLNLEKSELTLEMDTIKLDHGHMIVGGKLLNQ